MIFLMTCFFAQGELEFLQIWLVQAQGVGSRPRAEVDTSVPPAPILWVLVPLCS